MRGCIVTPCAAGTLILMPARRPGIEIVLQKAFSPRTGGNFLPLSDESVV